MPKQGERACPNPKCDEEFGNRKFYCPECEEFVQAPNVPRATNMMADKIIADTKLKDAIKQIRSAGPIQELVKAAGSDEKAIALLMESDKLADN